jgi:glutamate/tyrosine decarboxylase-like PLP-dependent enzyme
MNEAANHKLALDKASFLELGGEMLELAAEWLEGETKAPLLEQTSGADLAALFDEPPPEEGIATEQLLGELREKVMRYSRRNGQPRYFAYVSAAADPAGALADLLASAMNQNATAWRSAPVAATLERQCLQWLDDLIGFEGGGHGLFLGGGSAANLHALGAAIQRVQDDYGSVPREKLVLYSSTETHLSLAKAARFLGLNEVRALPVNAARRLRPEALLEALRADRARGLAPAMVAGSAGTANAGTIDPLVELAVVCRKADVWFHVDGAYGAPAAMTQGYAHLRDGFARADSLSLDPHKWLYAPLDMGALLVRDPARLRAAYSQSAEYIAVTQTAPLEDHAFWDYGLELSRRFRALRLWFMFKLRGVDTYRQAITENIAVREYLDEQIRAEAGLELLSSDLSISCFRFHPEGADETTLNRLNESIQNKLLETGEIILSPTMLDGRYSLRICIVNFRTSRADMDWLLEHVLRFGRKMHGPE